MNRKSSMKFTQKLYYNFNPLKIQECLKVITRAGLRSERPQHTGGNFNF